MSSWYFSKDDQQEGPVTADQIVALDYPGIGRLAYFLISMALCIVFYVILIAIIFAALGTNQGGGAAAAGLLVGLLFVIGFFFLAVKRITNLGMSGWAILWALVPFMNIWIHWRLIACPAGYQDHRTLDTAGKVITGLWIGMFALAFLAPVIGGLARG